MCLQSSLLPCEMLWNHFSTQGLYSLTPYIREYPQTPFRVRVQSIKCLRCAPEGTLKHYFIIFFRIALLQESRIARNKASRWKKIELSVGNSVNRMLLSLATMLMLLSWWPLYTANFLCAFVINLTSPTAYQSKIIAWLRVKVHLSIPLLTVTLM